MKKIAVITTFILSAYSILISGCSTNLSLATSPPGVDVYAGEKLIGKTPLDLGQSSIESATDNGFLLELRKAGYQPTWVWIPKALRQTVASVNMLPFLSVKQETKGSQLSRSQTDKIVARLLAVQGSLLIDGSENDNGAEQLAEDFPEIAAANYLLAISKLKENDRAAARNSLKNALKLSKGVSSYQELLNEIGE